MFHQKSQDSNETPSLIKMFDTMNKMGILNQNILQKPSQPQYQPIQQQQYYSPKPIQFPQKSQKVPLYTHKSSSLPHYKSQPLLKLRNNSSIIALNQKKKTSSLVSPLPGTNNSSPITQGFMMNGNFYPISAKKKVKAKSKSIKRKSSKIKKSSAKHKKQKLSKKRRIIIMATKNGKIRKFSSNSKKFLNN